jgi:hypothetical protein
MPARTLSERRIALVAGERAMVMRDKQYRVSWLVNRFESETDSDFCERIMYQINRYRGTALEICYVTRASVPA